MGWWEQNEQGVSFASAHGSDQLVWGDGPADILDRAVEKIVAEFQEQHGRRPSKGELRAGFEFSLGIYDERGTKP